MAESAVDCIEIPTRAPNNPLVKFWYRVSSSYDSSRREQHRVLVLFGGRNADGRPEVSGKLGWTAWADLNGIFLDALDALAAKFRVATRGLLFYGYSAGSQAANLFPAWRPNLCRAYVSHACGVFHAPSPKMRDVAGLVTCGDADTARYVLSRRFVDGCRALGVPVVRKSFPNRPHDVPEGSARLAREFLARHHWTHPEDLGGVPLTSAAPSFVGDDADGTYHPSGSPEAADVMPEDRVELPSAAVAAAWGVPGRAERRRKPCVSFETIRGVEVVFVVPDGVRADARVLVLLGGRGWCLVAPSFAEGDYWKPASGSAEVLRLSLDALCRRHGVRPLPVFLYGYRRAGSSPRSSRRIRRASGGLRSPSSKIAFAEHGDDGEMEAST